MYFFGALDRSHLSLYIEREALDRSHLSLYIERGSKLNASISTSTTPRPKIKSQFISSVKCKIEGGMANPTSKPFYGWPSSYAVSQFFEHQYFARNLVQTCLGAPGSGSSRKKWFPVYFFSSYGKLLTIFNLFQGLCLVGTHFRQ